MNRITLDDQLKSSIQEKEVMITKLNSEILILQYHTRRERDSNPY